MLKNQEGFDLCERRVLLAVDGCQRAQSQVLDCLFEGQRLSFKVAQSHLVTAHFVIIQVFKVAAKVFGAEAGCVC